MRIWCVKHNFPSPIPYRIFLIPRAVEVKHYYAVSSLIFYLSKKAVTFLNFPAAHTKISALNVWFSPNILPWIILSYPTIHSKLDADYFEEVG